jgi:hypothetical protein
MGTAQFGNMPSELKGFVVGHAVNAWRFQELRPAQQVSRSGDVSRRHIWVTCPRCDGGNYSAQDRFRPFQTVTLTFPCVLIGDRHIEHLHLLSLRQRRSDEQDQEKLPTICAFLYCAAGGQPDCMRSSAGGAAFCYVES